MPGFFRLPAAAFVFLLFFTFSTSAQECRVPEISTDSGTGNIFSEEQEMFLGDAIAQQVQKDFRVIESKELNGYLDRIGERLVRHLPRTGLTFRFAIVDIPDVNAFAMPGGRIYVTRKLIAFVRSEDELAGILAHELGHGIVRHSAIDISKYFREVLNVTSVGDRADVFEKYNQLLDRQATKRVKVSRSHVGDQQLEADRIGVYAMTAAGYDPSDFTSAFDRLFETEGKTGSWFSDLFGSTTPEQKRLREIVASIGQLPQGCVERGSVGNAEQFADWQSSVVALAAVSAEENLTAVVRRHKLAPGLRDLIRHLEFSPDGKHLIAQDESGIFVLRREPFEFLFRIDAPEALDAGFSPDSRFIVFNTPTLRVEKWSVAEKKPEMVREVFFREDCIQTALSDDGKTLACIYREIENRNLYINLKLIDVETNAVILEKDKFFRPDPFEYFLFELGEGLLRGRDAEVFQTAFSPNGRYFVAGRVFKNAYRSFSLTTGIQGRAQVRAGKQGILGYDLLTKEEIKIGDELRDIISSPFAFDSNDRIIGQDSDNQEKSGIFEFPSGKQIEKFELLADSLTRPHKGNYVLVRPIKVAPVGVYDLSAKKFVIANNNAALDVYGDVFVSENTDGVLGIYRLDRDETVATLELPESRFGGIRSLDASPDLNWLAVSNRERGAVWSTFSGTRMFYLQPFTGAFFDRDGKIYTGFSKTKETKRQIGVMDVTTKQVSLGRELPERRASVHGQFLLTTEAGDSKSTRNTRRTPLLSPAGGEIISQEIVLGVIYKVRDLKTDAVLWEREFEAGIPRNFFSAEHGTITFVWSVKSDGAKEEFKKDKALKQKADALGDKDGDYFVEVVEAATGKLLGRAFIETGEGSFRVLEAEAAGNALAIADSENRVQIFSLSDGSLTRRFFGRNFALNPANGTVAIGNLAGKLAVYEIASGRTLERMSFAAPIVYARYDKYGKKLLVVTSDQEAIVLDAEKFGEN